MKRIVGECNGCGVCCKTIALPIPHEHAVHRFYWFGSWVTVPRLKEMPETFRHYLIVHGVHIGETRLRVLVDSKDPEPVRVGHYNGGLVAYIRSRCAQLGDDNRCRVYESRPEVCKRYPTVLDDLSCVKPECGFEIVEG